MFAVVLTFPDMLCQPLHFYTIKLHFIPSFCTFFNSFFIQNAEKDYICTHYGCIFNISGTFFTIFFCTSSVDDA